MSSIEVKKQLHKYIDLADERMAKALLAMFSNYFQNQEDQVIGYTTKDKPLTKAQMIKEVMDAVNDVKAGNFLSSSEVRKNFKRK